MVMSRSSWRGRAYALSVILGVAALTGCSAPQSPPSKAEIAGTWHVDGPSGQVGTLTLSRSGNVEADGLPANAMGVTTSSSVYADWSSTVSFTGKWSVDKATEGGTPAVEVTEVPTDGSATGTVQFFILRSDEGFALATYFGDPDSGNKITYAK